MFLLIHAELADEGYEHLQNDRAFGCYLCRDFDVESFDELLEDTIEHVHDHFEAAIEVKIVVITVT